MKLGFIGMGSMGTAIGMGVLNSGFIPHSDLYFTDVPEDSDPLVGNFGPIRCKDNLELISSVDAVVLAVKPKHVPGVLREIKTGLGDIPLISIAGGVSLSVLETQLLPGARVVRVMPNINAMVKASMSAVCGGSAATSEDIQLALDLFNAVGRAIELEENLFGAFTAVAGCAPAWVFTFVEALAKAGVAAGLTKAAATETAIQMLLGSAKMLEGSCVAGDQHPGQLVDAVCSPGGSTIAGLLAGEAAGFSAAVVRMVEAAMIQDAKAAK